MKGRKRQRARSAARKAFVRGFVATGLLASVDRTQGGSTRLSRDSLRRALRGGFAIASGTLVAEKLSQRDYTGSAAALAAGTVCLAITDHYLTPSKSDHEDRQDGEEEKGEVQEVQEIQEANG